MKRPLSTLAGSAVARSAVARSALACSALLAGGVVGLIGGAGPASADAAAVFPVGSTETLVAHVAGLDAPVTSVSLTGLTPAAAASAVTAAQSAVARRVIALTAAPAHGKQTVSKVTVGSLLGRPAALALPAPGAAAYTGRFRLVLNPKAVAALATKSAAATTVTAVNASLRAGAVHPVLFDKGYDGATLNTGQLFTTLVRSIAAGRGTLPEKVVPALYGAKTLAKAIVVNTSANKLVYYVNGKPARTFVVATGQAGYPSPHGSFHVIAREAAPSWYNPHDPWSVSLPDVIGPGPDNPLGTRALQLDSPGILIHGIPLAENATLGQNASHGCVRMSRAEIETLFPLIPVGTPVLMTS